MPRQISFNGQIHSFPDDATEDEINQTLGGRESTPQETAFNQLKTKFPGMPEFVMKGLMSAVGTKPHPYLDKAAQIAEPIGEAAHIGGMGLMALLAPELGAEALPGIASSIGSAASKAGDIAPIFKFIEKTPYKNLAKYLSENNLGENVDVSTDKLLQAKKLLEGHGIDLPEEAIERAFSKALGGSHKSIHNIQSSLRSAGRGLSRKGGIEADLGQDMHKLAEEIMGEAKGHYENVGHPKASELMSQGKLRSARYHKISPYANAAKGLASAAVLPKWLMQLMRGAH